MSIRTGYSGTIYALTAYAEADTYYACTPFKMFYGADSVRLTLTNTVANAGTVTIKAEISNGASTPVYSQYGSEITVAMTSGDVKSIVLPYRFCGGDTIKVSFKASSVTDDPKLSIDCLAYLAVNNLVDGERTQLVSQSVTDTVLQLTEDSAETILVTGSASGYIVRTPVATAMTVGWTRKIKNASSEFIKVDNGAGGTLFEFVGPGCTAEITLTAASSVGTWVCEIMRPAGYRRYFSDFDSAGSANMTPDLHMFFGTGSSGLVGGGAAANRWGAQSFGLGTDAGQAGYANGWAIAFGQGYGFLNTGKPTLYKAKLDTTALSNGTDTYTIRAGVYDVSNGTQPNNGVYFEADADGDLIPVCRAAGSQTTIAAGGGKVALTSAAANSEITWIVNSAGSRADFWSEKAYIGNIALTIPKTTAMAAGLQVSRSAGTTATTVHLDQLVIEGGMR